jgi:hypothetical protein
MTSANPHTAIDFSAGQPLQMMYDKKSASAHFCNGFFNLWAKAYDINRKYFFQPQSGLFQPPPAVKKLLQSAVTWACKNPFWVVS